MQSHDYNPSEIEKKWQEYWDNNKTYRTLDEVKGKENFFALSEFAYPSGNLHVGHWYAFAVPDIYARFKRMQGYNVLYPMGFDAFGLPAENAAIKHGKDPKKWTYDNMESMRTQLRSMGASFDWDREIVTCEPSYYQWTQWMFTQFLKHDLVYRDITKVNWCEHDKTILANEQVVAGKCERCGNDVVQKDMAQWMLKITDFADDLVDDLDTLAWDESIKQAQREWIGRKEGSIIPFKIQESEVYDVNTGPGDDAFKEGEPIIERNNVVVIIEHPENDEFLCAKWKQVDWQGFVTGGIEQGKTIEETVLEEVREETGYQNPEIVKIHDQSSHGLFWHVVKQENRQANYRIVHVKLKDLEQVERSEEEQAIADFLWIPRHEVNDFLKREDMKYPWRVVHSAHDKNTIDVFTTRADTLFGATYLVLAPEHDMVQNLKPQITNWEEVQNYLKEVEKRSDLDRQQSKEKTGVQLKGIEAINPATGKPISIWIADYVLAHFGTGAVMAVPAHDERDCEFSLKYDLPFKFVMLPSAGEVGNSRPLVTYGENAFIKSAGVDMESGQPQINAEWNAMYDLIGECEDGILPSGKRFCCTFEGKLINSPGFNVKTSEEARKMITDHVGGKTTKTYRLRDWGISRQRYWGTPIPVVYNKEEKENIEKRAHSINFYAQDIWDELISGRKTVETRALNPEEPERYFGNTKEGDILRVINKNTKEEAYFKIINQRIFKSFEEYFEDKDILKKVFGSLLISDSIDKLKERYSFNESYVEKIEKNGLIAWELEKINPGVKIIPDEHLPWILPDDVDFTPDGTAPLARSKELKERTERIFGKGWTPEVDTMDTFVDSSWYFYRYLDPNNLETFAREQNMKNWMPVDMYFGGAEHTTMHLLYSRFWTKALHRLGLVSDKEPYKGRLNRGLILGPDGNKMSKSKGNVINPDEIVSYVGADTVRMYLAFIGPFNEPGNYPWDPNGVVGIKRFLERVWKIHQNIQESTDPSLTGELHLVIKKVEEDIERMKLNTAISAMMIFINKVEKSSGISKNDFEVFLRLLAPFAPHITEELWMKHHTDSIHLSEFPRYRDYESGSSIQVIPIQINGKRRAEIEIGENDSEENIKEKVFNLSELQKWFEGKEILKFIYVPKRIINIVIKQ